jgi:nitrite reductase/ring-hydroxylating ferredoxin subunit
LSAHSVALCRLEDLTPGEARRFVVEGLPVAVVRIGDDVYAIGDRCTHQNLSLSEGEGRTGYRASSMQHLFEELLPGPKMNLCRVA